MGELLLRLFQCGSKVCDLSKGAQFDNLIFGLLWELFSIRISILNWNFEDGNQFSRVCALQLLLMWTLRGQDEEWRMKDRRRGWRRMVLSKRKGKKTKRVSRAGVEPEPLHANWIILRPRKRTSGFSSNSALTQLGLNWDLFRFEEAGSSSPKSEMERESWPKSRTERWLSLVGVEFQFQF